MRRPDHVVVPVGPRRDGVHVRRRAREPAHRRRRLVRARRARGGEPRLRAHAPRVRRRRRRRARARARPFARRFVARGRIEATATVDSAEWEVRMPVRSPSPSTTGARSRTTATRHDRRRRAGGATSTSASCRSRSTRSTSRRASPRCGSASRASGARGVLALLYGIAVRDAFPDQFVDAHLALFAARHDKGLKLGHEDVLRDAVTSAGLDADAVAAEVWSGRPLKTLAAEHTEAVDEVGCVGRPDVHRGRRGGVRALHGARPRRRPRARRSSSSSWTRLNEFKRPTVPR